MHWFWFRLVPENAFGWKGSPLKVVVRRKSRDLEKLLRREVATSRQSNNDSRLVKDSAGIRPLDLSLLQAGGVEPICVADGDDGGNWKVLN